MILKTKLFLVRFFTHKNKLQIFIMDYKKEFFGELMITLLLLGKLIGKTLIAFSFEDITKTEIGK